MGEHRGGAGCLHDLEWPDPVTRTAWVLHVTRPALVLGSTQAAAVVDAWAAARAGVEVVRRRSGGAAVLCTPDTDVWVDLFVPAGDPLWDADVSRAAGWVGRAWVDALASLGVQAALHEGPMVRNRWSGLVCFAGLAPGEVVLGAAPTAPGPKLVGVSARRRRDGVRFQTMVPGTWSPDRLVELLRLDHDERERAAAGLVGAAVGAVTDLGLVPATLVRALLDALPD